MTSKELKASFKAGNKAVLEQGRTIGFKCNVEILGGNRCMQAMDIDGKIFPLEDLLKKTILPYKSCKRIGGCNCLYAVIPARDDNGKLKKG